MNEKKWDKGEKRFLCGALLALLFFLGSMLWWGRFNEVPELNIPTPKMPLPNAYDTYQQAIWAMPLLPREAVDPLFEKSYRPGPKIAARRYTPARRAAFLKNNAAALAIFRRGLPQQFMAPPIRNFGQMWGPTLSWTLRDVANLVALQAKDYRLRGQWNQAAQNALDLMRFGQQMQEGGAWGASFQSLGRRELRLIAPHLDAATCKSAARRLEKIRAAQTPYWRTIQEQKWMMLSCLREEMRHADWTTRTSQIWGGAGRNTVDNWSLRFETKRSVLDSILRYYDQCIAEAKKPYAQARPVAPPTGKIANIVFNYTLGSNERFWHARAETGTALFSIFLALRAYRLEHGAYPEKLDALVPSYLSAIPADGFGSGEALRYQKRGDSFALWSIGPDCKDDGGKPINSPQRSYGYYYGDVNDGSTPIDATARGDWVLGPNG